MTITDSATLQPANPDQICLVAIPGISIELSYRVDSLESIPAVGSEVLVEVGRSKRRGWIIGYQNKSEIVDFSKNKKVDHQIALFPGNNFESKTKHQSDLKPVLKFKPACLQSQTQLFQWMSEYYGVTLAEIYDTALPQRVKIPKTFFQVQITTTGKKFLEDQSAFEKFSKRSPAQAQLLTQLAARKTPLDQTVLFATVKKKSGLKALIDKNLAAYLPYIPAIGPTLIEADTNSEIKLNSDQINAITKINVAIDEQHFNPFLLHGVTGSGKTEVYLNVIEHALSQGKSALVVVPEISLTPQLLSRFTKRLSQTPVVLHSQLNATERWSAWEALLRGDVRVAVGARSAIFAPMQNLGLIIIDEEHDSSLKQSDGLRYHGRDVALKRAQIEDCTILLGSATPAFESLLNVERGKYSLLELPERATQSTVPKIEIVNFAAIRKKDCPSENISPELFSALKNTLEQKQQAIVLYNRRGFSTYLQCETCTTVISCKHCSIPLTLHQQGNFLLCHYCGYRTKIIELCPICRDPKRTLAQTTENDHETSAKKNAEPKIGQLRQRGGGTERVVEELGILFPAARIARMDRDSVSNHKILNELLGKMHGREIDILVGTQMLAKGHDLPGVTLVGVINADVGLNLPDFRSSERVYQLIAQAAGRAGRGNYPGRVIVQTFQPNHPTIVALQTGRYKAFARYELTQRKELFYPPFTRLLRIIVSAPKLENAVSYAKKVAEFLSQFHTSKQTAASNPLQIIGPTPAPIERLRNRYRLHFLIKSNSVRLVSELARSLSEWQNTIKGHKDTRMALDIDPYEML